MKVIAVEPFYDQLQDYHRDHQIELEFWEWLKQEYGAYHVYLSSNYQATGEKDGSGLLFDSEEEATWFTLKWT